MTVPLFMEIDLGFLRPKGEKKFARRDMRQEDNVRKVTGSPSIRLGREGQRALEAENVIMIWGCNALFSRPLIRIEPLEGLRFGMSSKSQNQKVAWENK